MKKLMIAAAIVCAAAGSRAASASWDVSYVYDYADISSASPKYLTANNYATYFVVATTEFGAADAASAIATGDFSWLTSGDIKVDAPTTAMAGGAASHLTPDTWFGNEETVTGFMVIFNSDSYATADHAYVSLEASKATGGEGQAAALSFTEFNSYDPTKWTKIENVPEPTSGLLLLLGVAGLALKRKRA